MLLTAWHLKRSVRPSIEILALVATLAATACTVLVDRDRQQCLTDDDCRRRGGAFTGSFCKDQICEPDPTWSCLGGVNWAPADESRMFTVIIRVRDLITEQPMAGVSGRLCRKLDLTCNDPLGTEVVADQNGNLVAQVEMGFDGYFEIWAKDKLPGLYFFYPPVAANRDVPFVPMFSPAVLAQFAQLNGKQLVPDRGHVMLGAYDCQQRPAEGLRLITLDGDGETSPFYVADKFPKVTATETDRSGRGGFINLRPGTVTVAADLAPPDNRRVGAVSVIVRSGVITFTSLVPSPR
jgi:hypothetical protein